VTSHRRPPAIRHGRRHAGRLIVLTAVALLITTGCGPSGPRRFQLEGSVTFDGKPVPSGVIRFEPDASRGNRGPVGYAAIEDGRYTTATHGHKGALQGPLVVYMTGGPAPEPNVEFPVLWFVDHRTTIELDPEASVSNFDFDVPPQKKR